jgi:hypothetical protein
MGTINLKGDLYLLDDHALPYLVIRSRIDGQDTRALVADLRAFAQSKNSALDLYVPIAGATIATTTKLTEDLALISWAEVPECGQKKVFDELNAAAKPGCAIRNHLGNEQVLFSISGPDKGFEDELWWGKALPAIIERIEDVRRCMSAVIAGPMATIGRWIHLGNAVARSVPFAAPANWVDDWFGLEQLKIARSLRIAKPHYQITYSTFGTALPKAEVPELNADAIASMFEQFEKFDKKGKAALRVALDRINRASRSLNAVDRAIDLGVALEAMVLHETEGGELSYRMAVRGAAFLGGDKDRRARTFALLRRAYALRSLAVHTGRLESSGKSKNKAQPEETLNDAAKAGFAIAQRLIEIGSFPDWDDLVI